MGIRHSPAAIHGSGIFGPSTLDLLGRVVEEAWKELRRRSGGPAGSVEREQLTRELMAHRVMARALRGELDPERLKQHALWGF
jgi:hypothetical protein